jgi:hypothetical protein
MPPKGLQTLYLNTDQVQCPAAPTSVRGQPAGARAPLQGKSAAGLLRTYVDELVRLMQVACGP